MRQGMGSRSALVAMGFSLPLLAGCIIVAGPPEEAPQVDSPRRARSHRERPPAPRPRAEPDRRQADGRKAAPAAPAPAGKATPAATPTQVAVATIVQPQKSLPPVSRSRAILLEGDVARGRPPSFRPGADAAFWIWAGPRGSWRVRTTSKDEMHTFRGYIHGVSGDIAHVQPSRVEYADRIWPVEEGNRQTLAFSFKTNGHADGFIFSTRDQGCVRFDLQLDGGPQQKKIMIGQAEVQPASPHFIICPKGKAPPAEAAPAPGKRDRAEKTDRVPRLRPR